jgi:hypothetical protein
LKLEERLDDTLSAELLKLCGPEAFLILVERFGGRRLFIARDKIDAAAFRHLPPDVAEKLMRRFGGAYLRVPLARGLRARHYRTQGLSNGQICKRLGMTETGVDKMFAAMGGSKPVKGGQISLFNDNGEPPCPRARA